MAVLKCKMCGGNILPEEGRSVGVCDSCGSVVTLPAVTDERRTDAFNRGNHFRRVYEFDQALKEYGEIVKEDPEDAEAHWCMMLSRYGINYQQDHRTGERIPTCDRVSYTSVLEDPDYKAALKYANGDQKALYQEEIKRIHAIQQGILEVSAKEKPFDIFICFKDTDDKTGKRTQDSVLAQDLYNELVKRNYKVFFSRITLKEEHMGQEWEPYIFAALNSAKVMLVVGTTPENFSSPWVRNEWSRFLNLRRTDKTKILVPCVSGMNPNQLPDGLRELEGRDMSEISFMQDILYGIERVVRPKKQQPSGGGDSGEGKVTAENYVKRALMYIEDKKWSDADKMLEQALNRDPENGQAHLGKLLIERSCTSVKELAEQKKSLAKSGSYNRALKYGDLATQQQLRAAESQIQERLRLEALDQRYQELCTTLNKISDCEEALELAEEFEALGGHKNSADKAREARAKAEELRLAELDREYRQLCTELTEAESSEEAQELVEAFEKLDDYKGSNAKAEEARQKAEYLRKKEAEQQRIQEEKARKEAEEKAAKEQAERVAQQKAAKKRVRKRRMKRLRHFLYLVVILVLLGRWVNNKFLAEVRQAYSDAEMYMEAGDYQAAAVNYFAVTKSPISRIILTDAEEKGIEACTAWLGQEPVILTSEEYPWFGVDENGGLQFYPSDYDYTKYEDSDDDAFFPTILDGTLVTGFGEDCFENVSWDNTPVDVPANYTWVGSYAFAGCDGLTRINLSANTTSIEKKAFYNCDSLTAVVMPDSLEYLGESAFEGCDYLNSVTLNEGLVEIGEYAFYDCGSLKSITIPGTVQNVGKQAFYQSNLESLTLEEGVGYLGEKSFSSCDSLVSVTIPSTAEVGNYAFAYCDNLGTVVLTSGVTTIDEGAFRECPQLWNLGISDTLSVIGDCAFYQDGALSSISLPATITYIGASAFSGCDGIGEIWIADNDGLVIGDEAFYSCDSLSGASLGVGTTSLGESAFDCCGSMTWVTLPEGLTSIGNYCFAADALYEVSIPSTVTYIGEGAFKECDYLQGISIPAGVSILESGTFAYCDSLYWVWFKGEMSIIRDDAFSGCGSFAQVYYSGSADSWYAVSTGNNEVLSNAQLISDFYGN